MQVSLGAISVAFSCRFYGQCRFHGRFIANADQFISPNEFPEVRSFDLAELEVIDGTTVSIKSYIYKDHSDS